jgi:hypothetical protein
MCDIAGCGNPSEFYDPMGNEYCEDCMHFTVSEEEDVEYEDFEDI